MPIPALRTTNGRNRTQPIRQDLAWLRTAIVNVFFHGPPLAGDRGWVLIDTGIGGFADVIRAAAYDRFGEGARPAAILLTHGHFDHVGAVEHLTREWDAPVYAHPLEMPYLTGRSAYPPPDPSVGGGAMARLSFAYPRGPIDLGEAAVELPEDGTVPGMRGWRWIHTPGHTAGHVSFFRDSDRTLVAGDAFITVRQESALAVLTQKAEVHGPPTYYTPDWVVAAESVRRLAELAPELAGTGHGTPLGGEELKQGLRSLARDFEDVAVPRKGRYVDQPAITDERGVVSVPPARGSWPKKALLMVGAGALAGVVLRRRRD